MEPVDHIGDANGSNRVISLARCTLASARSTAALLVAVQAPVRLRGTAGVETVPSGDVGDSHPVHHSSRGEPYLWQGALDSALQQNDELRFSNETSSECSSLSGGASVGGDLLMTKGRQLAAGGATACGATAGHPILHGDRCAWWMLRLNQPVLTCQELACALVTEVVTWVSKDGDADIQFEDRRGRSHGTA